MRQKLGHRQTNDFVVALTRKPIRLTIRIGRMHVMQARWKRLHHHEVAPRHDWVVQTYERALQNSSGARGPGGLVSAKLTVYCQ